MSTRSGQCYQDPPLRGLGLLAVLLVVAWCFRLMSLWKSATPVGVADLRGFLADAAAASLTVSIALSVRWFLGRWAAVLPALAWSVLVVAAHEQAVSLGSPLTLAYARYLADPTFLAGSALRPGLLVQLALAMAFAGLGSARLLRARTTVGELSGSGLVAVVLGTALWMTTVRQDVQAWRQNLIRISGSPQASRDQGVRVYRRPDLGGSRWLGPVRGRPDVLLLVVEGVSGASLPMACSAHGRCGEFAMTNLDELARSAVTASSFITEQRQTNRGIYALLCGQSPRLRSGEARMTEIARGLPHPPCLPLRLQEAGYRTVFFEATPLPFMFMDAAMPKLGFERSLDDAEFGRVRSRNTWGVDDRSFLDGALDMVSRLDEEPGPWFLTLLTAGTHHPYDAIPGDFESSQPDRTLGRTMAYLDESIGHLVQGLEARTRNLVLIVVSDESAGWVDAGRADDLDRELAQNWGVLIVRTPDGATRRVDRPIRQSEVAISLLDLLEMAPGQRHDPSPLDAEAASSRSSGPGGRSLFRDYADAPVVAFGNTYQGRVTVFDPATGGLLRCPESLQGCAAFRSRTGTLFAAGWSPVEVPDELLGALRRTAEARDARVGEGRPERVYSLISPGDRRVRSKGQQLVFGGQYLDVPADSRVLVRLTAKVIGADGWLHVRHALTSSVGSHYRSDLPVLAAGDSFDLSYSFRTGTALQRLDARMLVDWLEGSGLSLQVEEAWLEIRSEVGGSTEVETVLRDVRRRNPPPVFRYAITDDASGRAANDVAGSGRAKPPSLLHGPKFYAAAGSEIKIRVVVESKTGHGTVRLLLGSEDPSLLLASGAPESVDGEPRELRLEHRLTATLNELVTGLQVEASSREASFELLAFEAEVEPP